MLPNTLVYVLKNILISINSEYPSVSAPQIWKRNCWPIWRLMYNKLQESLAILLCCGRSLDGASLRDKGAPQASPGSPEQFWRCGSFELSKVAPTSVPKRSLKTSLFYLLGSTLDLQNIRIQTRVNSAFKILRCHCEKNTLPGTSKWCVPSFTSQPWWKISSVSHTSRCWEGAGNSSMCLLFWPIPLFWAAFFYGKDSLC